jgi:AraC-like DNA-binding protein
MPEMKNAIEPFDIYKGSWVAGNNRFWNCPAGAYIQSLPLVIVMSGYTWWRRGEHYSRTNSRTFSIELVTGGDAEFVQDGRRHIVKPGQVFFVQKGKDNTFRPGPSGFLYKRMAIMEGIILDMTLRSMGLMEHDVITCRDPARVAGLIRTATRLMSAGGADMTWRISLIAYEILLELGKNSVEVAYPREVTGAITYMNSNMDRSLTLAEISRASGVSMFHFSRLFQKTMRCPPMTFFIRQKMALACNLLQDSQLLIKEIAMLLGYDDPFYFSAQFRKTTGMSPLQFRRSNSGPE